MNSDANALIASLIQRIARARRIADELHHDDKLHRLAMNTVFILEDATVAIKESFDSDVVQQQRTKEQ